LFTSPEQRADRTTSIIPSGGFSMLHPTSMRRRLVVTLVAAVVALLATASAATAQPAQHITQAGKATVVTPALACPYYYVCGKAANGHSFAYTRCNIYYELPYMVGYGPLNNNQTWGTTASFYDVNGDIIIISNAPDQRTVNWTPVWYAKACDTTGGVASRPPAVSKADQARKAQLVRNAELAHKAG
jgi:hypothetical protein